MLLGKTEEVQFTPVVPDEAEIGEHHTNSTKQEKISPKQKYRAPPVPSSQPPPFTKTVKTEPDTVLIDTKQKITPPSGDSSSDSVFTDALSPGCSTEINACYYSEESVNLDVEVPDSTTGSFLDGFALNNFKLNDYRVRREEELNKKLSKLGLSKTSQISLDSESKEWSSSEKVDEKGNEWSSGGKVDGKMNKNIVWSNFKIFTSIVLKFFCQKG